MCSSILTYAYIQVSCFVLQVRHPEQEGHHVWVEIRAPENASIYGDHYTSFKVLLVAQI